MQGTTAFIGNAQRPRCLRSSQHHVKSESNENLHLWLWDASFAAAESPPIPTAKDVVPLLIA